MSTDTRIVIRGGTVVLDTGAVQADVVIDGGTVEALVRPGRVSATSAETLDASGALVLPGGVDVHTHVGLSFGEFGMGDDFATATRAAALGGTTTILEFAIPAEGERPMEAIRRKRAEAAGVSFIDHGFHACITRRADDAALSDIVDAADAGVPSVKVFTAYRDLVMLDLGDIQAVMETASRAGVLVMVHAETESLVERAVERLARKGTLGAQHHPQSRPPVAELDAARSVLGLAESANCAVYLVHVTLPEVAEEIARARARGTAAHGETCPHYLLLDDSSYRGPAPDRFVCSPPLRSPHAVQGLWRHLGSALTGIHSDHCGFDAGQKAMHAHDLRRIPPGLPGIQTRLPVMLSEALRGRLALTELVRLCAAEPARLFGMPTKGSLLPGSDGDAVIIDPRGETLIAQGMDMTSDYSPFDGWRLSGAIVGVVARGQVLVENGKWTDPEPRGLFRERPTFPN